MNCELRCSKPICYEFGSHLSDSVPVVNSICIWNEIFRVMSIGHGNDISVILCNAINFMAGDCLSLLTTSFYPSCFLPYYSTPHLWWYFLLQ